MNQIASKYPEIISKLSKYENSDTWYQHLGEFAVSNPNFKKKEDFRSWATVVDNCFKFLNERKNKDFTTSFELIKEDTHIPIYFPKETFQKDKVITVFQFLQFILSHTYDKNIEKKHLECLICYLTLDDLDLISLILSVCLLFVFKSIPNGDQEQAQATIEFHRYFLPFAEGWGGRELGYELIKCCDEKYSNSSIGLHFEFFIDPEEYSQNKPENLKPGQNTIHLDNLHTYPESVADMFLSISKRFFIPKEFHFPLFVRIRMAKYFANYERRVKIISHRLQAFAFLAHINSSHVNILFRDDNTFLSELVELFSTNKSIPENIRILAGNCLLGLSTSGYEIKTFLNEIGCVGNNAILLSMLRRILMNTLNGHQDDVYTPAFVKNVFKLVKSLVNINEAASALKDSGLIALLQPLINHFDETLWISKKTLDILESLMETDESCIDSFRDLMGFEDLLSAIQKFQERIHPPSGKEEMEISPSSFDKKYLFLAFRLAALTHQGTSVASIVEAPIASFMLDIFEKLSFYGGSIYSGAVSLFSSILHGEPTSYPILQNKGLPEAFMNSISIMIPSSKALSFLLDGLSAISLNVDAKKKVESLLPSIFDFYSQVKFLKPLSKVSTTLGSRVEELIRHYNSFLNIIVDNILKALQSICNRINDPEISDAQAHQFVDNISSFLEPIFNGGGEQCRLFIERNGLELLLKLSTSRTVGQKGAPVSQVLQALATTTNSPLLLKYIFRAISKQFSELDSLCNWKEGLYKLLEEEKEKNETLKQVLPIVENLTAYVHIMNQLVRGAASIGSQSMEWMSEQGIEVCVSLLGQLQKLLLWESSLYSFQKKMEEELKKQKEKESSKQSTSVSSSNQNASPSVVDRMEIEEIEQQQQQQEEPERSSLDKLLALLQNFSKGVAKLFVIPPRKQDKFAGLALKALTDVLVDYFAWNPSQQRKYSFAEESYFLSVVTEEVLSLMFNERRGSAHTLLFHSFISARGIETFFQRLQWLLDGYMKTFQSLTSFEQTTVSNALNNSGKLMSSFVNTRLILSSSITDNMLTFTLPGEKGPFNPDKFINDIRTRVLNCIVPIWNHPHLSQFPKNFVDQVLHTVRYLLESEKSSSSSYGSKEKPTPKVFQPDPNVVRQLVDMGFSASHVESALRQIGENNVPVATEWLLNNPEEIPSESIGGGEEDQLAMALALSMGQSSSKQNAKPQETTTSSKSPEPPKVEDPSTVLKNNLLKQISELIYNSKDLGLVTEVLIPMYKSNSEEILPFIKTQFFEGIKEPLKGYLGLFNSKKESLTNLEQESTEEKQFGVQIKNFVNILMNLFNDPDVGSKLLRNFMESQLLSTILQALEDYCNILKDICHHLKFENRTNIAISSWFEVSLDLLCLIQEKGSFLLPSENQAVKYSPAQQKQIILLCAKIFTLSILPDNCLLPALKLSGQLTMNYEMAQLLLTQQDIISTLLQMKAKQPGSSTTFFICFLMRHLIEDPVILQQAMEAEIINIVSTAMSNSGNNRSGLTAKQLINNLTPVVCRDSNLFIEAAANVCRFSPDLTEICLVSSLLKPSGKEEGNKEELNTPQRQASNSSTSSIPAIPITTTTSQQPQESKSPSIGQVKVSKKIPSSLKKVLHAAMNSLIFEIKERSAPRGTEESENPSFVCSDVVLLDFLSQCAQMYPLSIQIMMRYTFSHSPSGTSNLISYLLHNVLPNYHQYTPPSSSSSSPAFPIVLKQKKGELCVRLLVSLCSKPDGRKKIVQETIVAMKNCIKNLPNSSSYPHEYHSLLELIYSLLSYKNNLIVAEISSLLLENDILNILTESIHSIDLNHPQILELIRCIMKPIELLSKTIQAKPNQYLSNQSSQQQSTSSQTDSQQVQTSEQQVQSTSDIPIEARSFQSTLQNLVSQLGNMTEDSYIFNPSENQTEEMEEGGEEGEEGNEEEEEEDEAMEEEVDIEGEEEEEEGREEANDEDELNEEEVYDGNIHIQFNIDTGANALTTLFPILRDSGGESTFVFVDSRNNRIRGTREIEELFNLFGASRNVTSQPPLAALSLAQKWLGETEISQKMKEYAHSIEVSLIDKLKKVTSEENEKLKKEEKKDEEKENKENKDKMEEEKKLESQESTTSNMETEQTNVSSPPAPPRIEIPAPVQSTPSQTQSAPPVQNPPVSPPQLSSPTTSVPPQTVSPPQTQTSSNPISFSFLNSVLSSLQTPTSPIQTRTAPSSQQRTPSSPPQTESRTQPQQSQSQNQPIPFSLFSSVLSSLSGQQSPQPSPTSTQPQTTNPPQQTTNPPQQTTNPSQPTNPSQQSTNPPQQTTNPSQPTNPPQQSINPPQQTTNPSQPTNPTNRASNQGGIDPTFLDALPMEMRQELLSSQLGGILSGLGNILSGNTSSSPSSNPSNNATNNVSTSSLDPEFLAALPEEIQAEVLENERQRISRENAAEIADTSLAQEMDTASFLATLTPDLREEILLSYAQDEAFLSSLTPQLRAEAMAVRDRHLRNRFSWRNLTPRRVNIPSSNESNNRATSALANLETFKGKPVVDEKGLLGLIRILFMRAQINKNPFGKLFLILSAWDVTRTQLLEILVSLLMKNKEASVYKPLQFATFEQALDHLEKEQKTQITTFGEPFPNTLLGYPTSLNYSVIDTRAPNLPFLVSRRFIDMFSYFIRNQPKLAEQLATWTNKTSQMSKLLPPIFIEPESSCLGNIINLLGVNHLTQNSGHIERLLGLISHTLKAIAKMNEERLKRAEEEQKKKEQEEKERLEKEKQEKEKSSEEKKEEKPKEEIKEEKPKEETKEKKPVHYDKIEPLINNTQLTNLVNVLSLGNQFTDQSFRYCQSIFEQLAENERICKELSQSLYQMAQANANGVKSNLDHLCSELEKKVDPALIFSVLGSSPYESNLLRCIKVLLMLEKKSNRAVTNISSRLGLNELWNSFESALQVLNTKYFKAKGSVQTFSPLLPIIEIFFITQTHEYGTSEKIPPSQLPQFMRFAEQYKRLLNDLIKQNPTLLEDSFAILLKIPQLLDLDNKRVYFRNQVSKSIETERDQLGEIKLSIRRSQLFQDSFHQLTSRSKDRSDLKGKLSIQFLGEEGIDAGGVSREWYQTLAREMFNPNYCLFIPTSEGTFQPNKNSSVNPDHLAFFEFVGLVIGKALHDGFLLDAHFTRSFYKHILGIPVSVSDMEAFDPDYYKSLKSILDYDISNTDLDLTFSFQQDQFGKMELVDLKPDGRNIPVTEENKHEYVNLIVEMKLTKSIRKQIDSFLEGFHALIKPEWISIFTPTELELLISGLPDIDIEDLRKNTEYRGYTPESPVIQWFWKVLSEFSQQEKALLLQFVTGTSKVPLEGFKALVGMSGPQKFQIHKVYEKTRLPTAHTCFNQLDLPDYSSFEELKKNLTVAIQFGSEGFGFG